MFTNSARKLDTLSIPFHHPSKTLLERHPLLLLVIWTLQRERRCEKHRQGLKTKQIQNIQLSPRGWLRQVSSCGGAVLGANPAARNVEWWLQKRTQFLQGARRCLKYLTWSAHAITQVLGQSQTSLRLNRATVTDVHNSGQSYLISLCLSFSSLSW